MDAKKMISLQDVMTHIVELRQDMEDIREALRQRNGGGNSNNKALATEIAALRDEMQAIKDEITKLKQQKDDGAGENAKTDKILAATIIAGYLAIMGITIYTGRGIRNDTGTIINGIYTVTTPQSPSHSAIPWSASWQAEQDRQARAAAAQAAQEEAEQ